MLKQALDFALLEDFDHLYRYANLYDLLDGKDAAELTDSLTEIMPGRPTIVEHRHPYDDVRGHYETHTVDPLSRMHVMTIVAAEQQTMNFYMNHGTDWIEPIARGLYAEIAMIEEQHVTHYESLLDPLDSWLKQLVFHEYNEVYLYWSMLQHEEDPRIKAHLGAAPQHGDRPAPRGRRPAAPLRRHRARRDPARRRCPTRR